MIKTWWERRLGEEKEIQITGFFIAFYTTGNPCVVEMPNNVDKWIAIFSTVEKLKESCSLMNIKNYNIKEITDGTDFIESIKEQGFRIMLDPHIVGKNTRWIEISPTEKTK